MESATKNMKKLMDRTEFDFRYAAREALEWLLFDSEAGYESYYGRRAPIRPKEVEGKAWLDFQKHTMTTIGDAISNAKSKRSDHDPPYYEWFAKVIGETMAYRYLGEGKVPATTDAWILALRKEDEAFDKAYEAAFFEPSEADHMSILTASAANSLGVTGMRPPTSGLDRTEFSLVVAPPSRDAEYAMAPSPALQQKMDEAYAKYLERYSTTTTATSSDASKGPE